MRKRIVIICFVLIVLLSSGCIGGDQTTTLAPTTTHPPTRQPVTTAPATTPPITTHAPMTTIPTTTTHPPTTTAPPTITPSTTATDIPMIFHNWIEVNTPNVKETPDGIKANGAGPRSATHQGIQSKDKYNFIGSETFIKWKANGGSGNFAAFWVFLMSDYNTETFSNSGLVRGGFFTTSHSYKSSTVVTEDAWYYTRIKVNADSTYTTVTSTGDYDSNGGATVYTGTGTYENADNGNIVVILQDNYGGTEAYLVVGEVKTTASVMGITTTPPPTTTAAPTTTPPPTTTAAPTTTPPPTTLPPTSSYTLGLEWGEWGTENSQFSNPMGITIDKDGNIYVVERGNHRVQKFTSVGTFITKWGTYGFGGGQGEFYYPTDVATDKYGNVYVVDDRIQKFTSNGEYITEWTRGFKSPWGIAVDKDDNVYVADTGAYRIQKFTSDGTFITEWGTKGSENGQFETPQDVTVDENGDVYVGDYSNQNIQKFTSDGVFITSWGTEGTEDELVGSVNSIAVDIGGNVFAVEALKGQIRKYTGSGEYITKFESYDLTAGIAVANNGNIYLTDGYNHVRMFTPS